MPDSKRNPAREPPFRPPQHEIEAFARCVLPAIQAYFESEAGRQEFAACKEEKARK
jgi:hypothetical protein